MVFSNQGATVRSWLLKKHMGNDGKPLELVNIAAGLDYPFSLHFPGEQPASKVNWVYFVQTPDPDGLGVAFEFSDGHTSIRKTFRFQKNSYLLQVTSEAKIDGKPVPNMIEWRGGFGDLTVANPAAQEKTGYFDVGRQQAGGADRPDRQERARHRGRQLFLRRNGGCLFLRRVPAGG